MNTQYPTLFKYDNAKRLREWRVEQENSAYRTHTGIAGGSIVVSSWTICEGNQQRPDPTVQCLFEIEAMYAHRLARTYHTTATHALNGAHFFEPMLAKPVNFAKVAYPIYVQPKLDGMRCIVTADGMFTRQGKEILSAPHISAALVPYFQDNPDAILDGELYSDKLADDFQKIMSLARKTKNISLSDLEESAAFLEFHMYDAPHLVDADYPCRYAHLKDLATGLPNARCLVATYHCDDKETWDTLHATFIEQGYEGSMGRVIAAPYQQKRTADLMKRKDFDDAEFCVASIGEGDGNWSGACKRVYCWLPKTPENLRVPEHTTDSRYTFIATPAGTYDSLTKVLYDPIIPAFATVRYLGWTTTDNPKPRHPIATDLHYGPRQD